MSYTLEKLLSTLTEKRASLALESLLKPQTRDAFEYGARHGRVLGLTQAIEEITNALKEERDDVERD